MKLSFFPESARCPAIDDTFELLTLRYQVAFTEYRWLVDRNTGLHLSGARPSELALCEEERALDDLDVARQALVDAAARAHPTVH